MNAFLMPNFIKVPRHLCVHFLWVLLQSSVCQLQRCKFMPYFIKYDSVPESSAADRLWCCDRRLFLQHRSRPIRSEMTKWNEMYEARVGPFFFAFAFAPFFVFDFAFYFDFDFYFMVFILNWVILRLIHLLIFISPLLYLHLIAPTPLKKPKEMNE